MLEWLSGHWVVLSIFVASVATFIYWVAKPIDWQNAEGSCNAFQNAGSFRG